MTAHIREEEPTRIKNQLLLVNLNVEKEPKYAVHKPTSKFIEFMFILPNTNRIDLCVSAITENETSRCKT